MKELFRVLKKNGWAIMQVPINRQSMETLEDASIIEPKEREKAFGLKEHVRYYASENYSERLKDAGFIVKVDDYTKEFSDKDNFKYGFWKGDPVYYCTK